MWHIPDSHLKTSLQWRVYVYSWWKPQCWLKALYFIFSVGSFRFCDFYRCELGRCCTFPFLLTFLSFHLSKFSIDINIHPVSMYCDFSFSYTPLSPSIMVSLLLQLMKAIVLAESSPYFIFSPGSLRYVHSWWKANINTQKLNWNILTITDVFLDQKRVNVVKTW